MTSHVKKSTACILSECIPGFQGIIYCKLLALAGQTQLVMKIWFNAQHGLDHAIYNLKLRAMERPTKGVKILKPGTDQLFISLIGNLFFVQGQPMFLISR
jgi:hypothetical protein